MKGLKWLKMSLLRIGRSSFGSSNLLLILFLSVFVSCLMLPLFASRDVSAFNLSTVGGGTFATGTNQSYFSIYYNPTDGRKNFSFGTDQGGTITGRAIGDSQVPAGGKLDYIWLRSDRLPSSALVSFDVRFNMPGASTTAFTGFEINDYATILSQQCKDNGTGMPNASVTATKDWTCHFLVYTGTDFYPSYGIQINARILDVAAGEGVVIMVSPFSYARVTSESGGSVDVSEIEDKLDDIMDQLEANNYSTSLSNISSVLNTMNTTQSSSLTAINSLRDDLQAQTEQEHNDYLAEVEREEDKQDELETQSGDLSISAQNPGNPFANLFQTSGCVSMPVFSGWFHRSDVIQVCSPYPQEVRPIIEFVSSVIVVGFLIKIYFKLFKGGYAS